MNKKVYFLIILIAVSFTSIAGCKSSNREQTVAQIDTSTVMLPIIYSQEATQEVAQESETFPIFRIVSVVRDQSVSINAENFPPNDTFYVRLNWIGTRGVAGAVVQTVTTDANGKLDDVKFPIPDYMKGQYQIAIRLESPTSGYYAYNWFYNGSPANTLAESRQLLFELDYPVEFRVDQSETMKIQLRMDSPEYRPPLIDENHALLLATPVPVGTSQVPLAQAYGEDYLACITLNFEPGKNISTSRDGKEEKCLKLDQSNLVWPMVINAEDPGTEPIFIWFDMTWKPLVGFSDQPERDTKNKTIWDTEVDLEIKRAPLFKTEPVDIIAILATICGGVAVAVIGGVLVFMAKKRLGP